MSSGVLLRPGARERGRLWVPSKRDVFGSVAGLVLNLDASAIGGLADGDPVTTWEDSSSANNDAVQNTAAAKPTYQTAEQNGLPGVLFDGTDDSMSVAGVTNSDATRTVFAVAKAASLSGTGTLTIVGWASTARLGFVVASSAWRWAGPNTDIAGPATTTAVLTVRFNSITSADFYKNAGSATNLDPNDVYQSGSAAMRLGEHGGAGFSNSMIFQVLVYDSALSDTDRATVRDELNSKWAVY